MARRLALLGDRRLGSCPSRERAAPTRRRRSAAAPLLSAGPPGPSRPASISSSKAAGPARSPAPGLGGSVRSRSRPLLPAEPRLGRRLHANTALHAHVPHSPRGALERRRPGYCTRLRLHLANVLEARADGLPAGDPPGPRSGCQDGQGRLPLPLRRVARPLRSRPAAARTRRRGPEDDLARPDRQPEDGGSDRQRAVPRRPGRPRPPVHARPKPALLGPAPGLPRPPCLPLSRSAVPGIRARGPARRDRRCDLRSVTRARGHGILP